MSETECHIVELIRQGESLRLEFKSDRKRLPEEDLIAVVVSLANTEGGDLFYAPAANICAILCADV